MKPVVVIFCIAMLWGCAKETVTPQKQPRTFTRGNFYANGIVLDAAVVNDAFATTSMPNYHLMLIGLQDYAKAVVCDKVYDGDYGYRLATINEIK